MFTGEFERALHHLQLSLEKMSTRVYHSDVWLNIGLIYQSLDRLPEAQNALCGPGIAPQLSAEWIFCRSSPIDWAT